MANLQEIIIDIQSHYKDTVVEDSQLSGEYLIMKVNTRTAKCPYIAKRVLDRNKDIHTVHFTGGWLEGVYTRETLKWAGYKMK